MSGSAPGTVARPERDVYTVSRLNREVRALLERGFGSLWLEAEISNFAKPSSGHWYFSLKDASAQVRCCMFRQRNMLCSFAPRDGQKVLVRARIGLVRAARRISARHRSHGGRWARRSEAAIRGIERETGGRGPVCPRTQAPVAGSSEAYRRDHLARPAPPCATSCMCLRGAFPRSQC